MVPGWIVRQGPAPLCAAGLALVARAIALAALAGTPLTRVMVGDARHYAEVAATIARGGLGEVGVFFLGAPLYPLLLAPIRAVTGAVWLPAAAAQAAVGSLACAAIARTASAVFPGERAAPWLAGIAAALYAPMVYFDAEVLPASLAASLVAFVLALVLRPGGKGRALAAGALVGLASLLAPALVLLAPLAAACVLRAGPRREPPAPAHAALLLAATLAVIAPVTLHNLRAGDFVPIASSAGVNAFIGNNPEANGSFHLPPRSGLDGARLEQSAKAAAEQAEGRALRPSEVSAHWLGRAVRFAIEEPGRWVRLVGKKALLALNHYEIPNHLNFQFVAARFAPALAWGLQFWMLLPFAALGTALALARGPSRGWPVPAVALACLAVPVLFFATARYRLPAAPALLVLGGGGAAWLAARLAARRWSAVAGALALMLPLVWASRLRLVREGDYAFDHLILGHAYREMGRMDDAVGELKLAVETESSGHEARLWLARAYEDRGDLGRAANVLLDHLERRPDDAAARAYLSRLASAPSRDPAPSDVPLTDFEISEGFLGRGDVQGAARALERAIERDPAHVRAMVQLAWVRVREDDLHEAFELLRRAVRLDPADAEVWKDLARIYHRAGDVAAARQAAERALRLDPFDAELRGFARALAAPPGEE
jgi:tetratricopeptide (TPR) repeat protein